jgi:hypothetical protein
MNRRRTRQLTLVLMGSFVALLAAAVFLWGVAYKVSLYPVHRKAATVPVAKLLSEKERPAAKPVTKSLCLRLSLAACCSFLLFLASRLRVPRAAFRCAPLPMPLKRNGHRPASLHHFSFRPPPLSIA